MTAQNGNRRISLILTLRGKSMWLAEWSRVLGVTRGRISYWMKKGKSFEEVVAKLAPHYES